MRSFCLAAVLTLVGANWVAAQTPTTVPYPTTTQISDSPYGSSGRSGGSFRERLRRFFGRGDQETASPMTTSTPYSTTTAPSATYGPYTGGGYGGSYTVPQPRYGIGGLKAVPTEPPLSAPAN